MFSIYKNHLSGIYTNLKGKLRLGEKLLIIESDDWGSIRTPSRDALNAFNKRGFELDKSLYKVDALESQSDLEDLFDLLSSYKNVYGENPIITGNSIMANPDFDKIAESDYREFHYERFTQTYSKYPEHQNNLQILKSAMDQNLYHPQFHGREHLNLTRWMKALQSGDINVRYSFNWMSTYSGIGDYSFMAAYDWTDPSEIEYHKKIIADGIQMFKEIFEFESESFIAPCYNWDSNLDYFLAEQGIKIIQGINNQLLPTGVLNRYKPLQHYFGEKNKYGSFYNIRNVFFEPVNNPKLDWSLSAMARINAAFLMKRPAVICTHRVNYIGYIDPKNKDNGLKQLGILLKKILNKWPDVKFITTDKLKYYFLKDVEN